MRINQFLAFNLNISRRKADEYIEKGLVEINGGLASLGEQIKPEDKLKVFINNQWKVLDGIVDQDKIQTMLFYKPIFCITSKFDPQKRKTIYHFLPKKYHHLKPAGRLDYMSEGLIVLSNDGALIDSLTHPKNDHTKQYLISTRFEIKEKSLNIYKKGMNIDDYDLNPVDVEKLDEKGLQYYEFLSPNPNLHWYIFTLSEGRNNQIRKMVEFDGQKVLRLIRISQGKYKLTNDLKINKFNLV